MMGQLLKVRNLFNLLYSPTSQSRWLFGKAASVSNRVYIKYITIMSTCQQARMIICENY